MVTRAELLEQNERRRGELLADLAKRRARADDPITEAREWVTPPREIPPYVTRDDVQQMIRRGEDSRIEDRLEVAVAGVAETIGQEVARVNADLERRVTELERAIAWLTRKEG